MTLSVADSYAAIFTAVIIVVKEVQITPKISSAFEFEKKNLKIVPSSEPPFNMSISKGFYRLLFV